MAMPLFPLSKNSLLSFLHLCGNMEKWPMTRFTNAVSTFFTDVDYRMAGLRRCVQAVRVHVEAGQRQRERGPKTTLFFAANVQWSVPVFFNGN